MSSSTLAGRGGRLAPAAPSGDSPASPEPRSRGAARRGRGWLTIAVFLAPALVLFALLVLTPIGIAAYTSFFKWNGFGSPTNNVGWGNFAKAFHDDVFLGDLRRGAVLIVLSLVIQLPVSLALAMLLNQPLRGRAFYRLLFFAPYVLSEVITAVLFTMIFTPDQGLLDKILAAVHLSSLSTTWLANTDLVLYTLFLVISWKYFGLHMILYLAARQGIPNELIESAATEGATPWQTFRHVTLPLLAPTIRISVFLSVLGAIQLFDLVYVLTGGGPIHASETMAVTMYQHGFVRFEVGYASAISILMFLICLTFGLIYQRFVLRRDLEGAVTTMRKQP